MNRQGRAVQALAGYAVDVYRLARFDVTNPHSLSKFRALRSMQRRTNAKVFIETGTHLGVTTRRCAPHFEHVYTIELDEALARQARAWLAKELNVTVIQGDADREVRRLFEERDIHNALLFLDGHFSGGVTAQGSQIEPALDILQFLARYEERLAGIVVDDFREFGGPGWPKKWQLVKAAEELFSVKGFRLSVHFDLLLLERARA